MPHVSYGIKLGALSFASPLYDLCTYLSPTLINETQCLCVLRRELYRDRNSPGHLDHHAPEAPEALERHGVCPERGRRHACWAGSAAQGQVEAAVTLPVPFVQPFFLSS